MAGWRKLFRDVLLADVCRNPEDTPGKGEKAFRP
jgi:hypothetical protein